MDNMSSSLLFADGSAAALVTHDSHPNKGLHLDQFYAEVIPKGKKDMAWELSSSGFLMTLSQFIPDLLEEDFDSFTGRALDSCGLTKEDITRWCIHPGGKKILEAVHKSFPYQNGQLDPCYEVLEQYGNMSSPTILFVLKKIMHTLFHGSEKKEKEKVFGAAFGPGLTLETFVMSKE
jgi:predicted naringenin-chalcone synthase